MLWSPLKNTIGIILSLKLKIFIKNVENKKKILIVTGIYPPDLGGPAVFSSQLAKGLVEERIKCSVFTYSNIQKGWLKEQDGPDVFYVQRTKNGLRRYFSFFYSLSKISKNFDILYVTDLISVGIPCFFVKLLNKKIKLIFRIGGDFQWERSVERGSLQDIENYYKDGKFSLKEKIIFYLTNLVLKKADVVIFNAYFLQDLYIRYRNIEKTKAFVIRNINSTLEIGRTANVKNKNDKEIIILFGGRLVPLKNVEKLLKAFCLLKNRKDMENVCLEIVGEGPEKKRLSDYINDNLKKSIKFYSKLDYKDFLNKIFQSDIVVNVSFSEVNPNLISDALALYKPVVLTKFSEFFYTNDTSKLIFYIDPYDIEDISEKMEAAVKQLPNLKNIIFENKVSLPLKHVLQDHLDIFNKI